LALPLDRLFFIALSFTPFSPFRFRYAIDIDYAIAFFHADAANSFAMDIFDFRISFIFAIFIRHYCFRYRLPLTPSLFIDFRRRHAAPFSIIADIAFH
jgi:hypothetical protein